MRIALAFVAFQAGWFACVLGAARGAGWVGLCVVAAVALAFGMAWQPAMALGMILALSSTAIVLQTLGEKGLMKAAKGAASRTAL